MDTVIKDIRELQDLVTQVTVINETLTSFHLDSFETDSIDYGSKVQLKNHDGSYIEGRVWGINKQGEIQVNRDGFKSFMNCKLADLKNLSVGTIGKLEKQKWIKERRIEKLTEEISKVRIDFLEFGLDRLSGHSTLKIEIIDSMEIKNTSSKLIILRKWNDKEIRKVVSSELNLSPGLYLFYFYMGVLTKVSTVADDASG